MKQMSKSNLGLRTPHDSGAAMTEVRQKLLDDSRSTISYQAIENDADSDI